MTAATDLDFKNTLNPEQHAAVTHGKGPQLVLAGAGSGKTRVITYRVAWLVKACGVDPRQITAVTFTNKAAGEMRERIEKLLGLYPLPSFVGTFHRFTLRQLRAYGSRVGLPSQFSILDASDQKTLVKKAIKLEELPEKAFPPQAMLSAISSAKNRLLDPVAYERQADDFFTRRAARVYRRYQNLIREAGGVDFDDMIRLTVELLRQDDALRQRLRRRIQFLLVDEFQDTNHAQLSLIHELCGGAGQLTAVGDEDQSIYRWRGAEIDNILEFERSFPGATIRKLERNYRSTQNILDASGAVIAHNAKRRGKRLWTESGAGENLVLYKARDELDEARWVASCLKSFEPTHGLSAMAVLVRTHAQTRALEDELLRQDLPYALIGGLRFYERAEIKDLIAYLRLVRNPHDLLAFSRVLNRPPRGIGKSTSELVLDRAAELGRSPWEVLVAGELTGVAARGVKALQRFRKLIEDLQEETAGLQLGEVLTRVLEKTDYARLYDKDDEDSQSRLENIREFLSAAQEFTEARGPSTDEEDRGLTAFLDHVSLASSEDHVSADQRVSLLTLHSAKGLEFPVVILAGLEEGLLPHFNARAEADIEEERRLLYVGMTRAGKRLLLTHCRRRRIAGLYKDQLPSLFLQEIPERLIDVEESSELFAHSPQADSIYSFFGREQPTAPSLPSTPSVAAVRTVVPEVSASTPSRSSRVRPGSLVRHAKLGRGRVLSIEGSGDETRLSIYFDGLGKRKLVARFAQLEVLNAR